MYFFNSGYLNVLLIYLNVTLGINCTIIHVSYNKIALYGKCVYKVCFAKPQSAVMYRFLYYEPVYIVFGKNTELS